MSHHPCIGQGDGTVVGAQIGRIQLASEGLKQHFDPHGIMNPGGTLALDLPEEEKSDVCVLAYGVWRVRREYAYSAERG